MIRFKEKFTPLEWQSLQFSIMWVFQLVAGADGHIDPKEQMAIKFVTTNSWKFDDDLVRELLESIHVNPAQVFKMSRLDTRSPENGLKAILKIIDGKMSLPQSILFRKSLIAIGYLVANMSGGSAENLQNVSNISIEEIDALATASYYLNLSAEEMQASPTIQDIVKGLTSTTFTYTL